MTTPGLILTAGLALVIAIATRPILSHLPEPLDDPDIADKRPYASLGSPGFLAAVFVIAVVASGLVAWIVPPTGWLAWAALIVPGVLAIAIDGATTWLPRVLTTAMALIAGVGIALWAILDADASIALRGLLGALAVGGFFYLFWRFTGGIGFGDVRLMAVVGAVAAARSAQTASWGVLIGTLLGAIWGVTTRLVRGPGPFPYGPALWSGPFVALAISALTRA